jgi:hypothetical protein
MATEYGDLLEVLGDVPMTDYCGQRGTYTRWEEQIARPRLKALGFAVQGFRTLDGDSFGPLVRAVVVSKGGCVTVLSYG